MGSKYLNALVDGDVTTAMSVMVRARDKVEVDDPQIEQSLDATAAAYAAADIQESQAMYTFSPWQSIEYSY